MMRSNATHLHGQRRGILTMELVLTLPILIVMLLGIFQFSLLFYGRELVVEAARAGARKATLPGVSEADVQAEVRRVLPDRFLKTVQVVAELGERTGDVVSVGVGVPATTITPDLLWMIGVSLKDQTLYSETRMIRE